jgi:predicted anti-sigma-YlaC factor YlaD
MMNCRQVSELLSKDALRDAPLWTRLGVKAHLAMCRHCTRFARQLATIRVVVRDLCFEQSADPEFESRIVQKLQREAAG